MKLAWFRCREVGSQESKQSMMSVKQFFALDNILKKRWLRYFCFFRLISFLPRFLAYRLATYMGKRDFRRDPEWAKLLTAGLKLAYPELPEADISCHVKANFQLLARETCDVFRFSRMSRSDFGRGIAPVGFELLREAQAAGKGVIILMGHYGRPMMLSTALGLSGYKIGMLSQAVDERNPGLNPVERQYLQYKMKEALSRSGGSWVTTKDPLRALYRLLQAGETIIIMQDVAQLDREKGISVPFLGGTLTIPKGSLRLAQQTGAKLLYGVAKELDSAICVELRDLPADKTMAVQVAAKELEKDVRDAPWQWWQWYHLHQVWNPPVTRWNAK